MTAKLMGLGISLALLLVWADVEHKESRQLSYTMPASGKLIVDNVFGGIRVTSHSGREVRVNVEEHWTAETQEKLAEGRKQVRLDATQDGNTVKLFVDGPFRCSECCCNCCSRGDRGYRVRHHFDIAVPVDTALELKTVNGGGITAQGTRGDFDLRNVNGQIDVQDIAGSGKVHTVNGRIHVAFAENPRGPLSFKTINGEVAVEFQPGVSGDFRFRTRNGQAYTDFEIAALPSEPVQVDREGGKSIFRMNHFSGVRIGSGGGPEHRFETLNGNIRILKRGK